MYPQQAQMRQQMNPQFASIMDRIRAARAMRQQQAMQQQLMQRRGMMGGGVPEQAPAWGFHGQMPPQAMSAMEAMRGGMPMQGMPAQAQVAPQAMANAPAFNGGVMPGMPAQAQVAPQAQLAAGGRLPAMGGRMTGGLGR